MTATFRPSLINRARKRNVTPTSTGWQVDGNSTLGDAYPHYHVTLNQSTHRYHCACYDTQHGDTRQRKICSHALAVILFRRDNSRQQSPLAAGCEGTGSVIPALPVPLPNDERFKGKLPGWVGELRPHQWRAVEQIMDAYASGAKVVFLDAPTGAGKSLIARMVSAMVGGKSLYVCTDKSLQHQFEGDFPSASVLKGRANYTPETWGDEVTCADCTLTTLTDNDCSWCVEADHCPYRVAKMSALYNELTVLNTAYFLAEANSPKTAFGNKQRGLVVLDEADSLERMLMGYVEASVSEYRAKQLGIGRPEFVTKHESVADWVAKDVVPKVKAAVSKLPSNGTDVKLIRRRMTLSRLLDSFKYVEAGLRSGNWIFDGYKNGGAVFKPVRVDEYGREVLWAHGKRFLLMSATIISADELADSLGLNEPYSVVKVPMTFPVENRRVNIAPVADMSMKNADTEWPKMATAIGKILELHPCERILIHTVSYKLAEYIDAQLLDRRVIRYEGARQREATLKKFRETENAVLLAPSMERGVDLKDDECRVVVVAKLPFPFLGDRQVNARLHSKGGDQWYAVQTIRSLVQMTGRATRSETDWSVGYILDAQFMKNVWKNRRSLLPAWWKEALNFEFPVKSLRA